MHKNYTVRANSLVAFLKTHVVLLHRVPVSILTESIHCGFLSFTHQVVSESFVTPWIAACQSPLSKGFPRQEYWSGLPFPSPRDFPDPGIKPGHLHCRWILYCVNRQGSPSERCLLSA